MKIQITHSEKTAITFSNQTEANQQLHDPLIWIKNVLIVFNVGRISLDRFLSFAEKLL